MKPAPRPRRPPYWTLVAFAVLISIPVSWAVAAMLAAVAIKLAVAAARGSARRSAERAALQAEGGGVRLGVDERGREVRLSDRQLAAHGLIVGASGAGKSTTLLGILCDQISRGLPVVAIDLKGSPSFARELERAAALAGRPFRVWTPDGPSHWNPLAHGNATELKDKLIATERFTEPHYQRAAERYVQTAIAVLHAAGREPQIAEVVALLEPKRLAAMVRHLDQPLASRVQDYVGGLTADQVSAVRGLGTRLAILSESNAGPYLASAASAPGASAAPGFPARLAPTIDLRAALEGPEVVLFSLNSSVYGKLAAQLGTLAIQDLVSAAGHRLERGDGPDAPCQATVGIDEFSALGADHVLALLARGRGAGVSVVLATQELADLERAGPGFRDQVLGVTAVKLAHRQDVPASAQTISQMAGTERVWEVTQQIGSPFSGSGSRGTRRQVEQFVVHPNEIKALQTGQAVMLTKTPVARTTRVRVAPPRHDAPSRGSSAGRHGLERGDQPDPGVTR
ncbi:MAG: type IV secretory system conjugative DNA transfer family protein [Solirubrobacteraceae bacterium]